MSVPHKCPECGGAMLVSLDEVMGRIWECAKCDFTFDEDFREGRHVRVDVDPR